VLRSIHFWSTIYIRDIYISNNSFTLGTLPKEMAVKILDQSHPYSNIKFIDLLEISNKKSEKEIRQTSELNFDDNLNSSSKFKDINNSYKIKMENYEANFAEIDRKGIEIREENNKRNEENMMKNIYQKVENSLIANEVPKKETKRQSYDLRETNNEQLRKNVIIYLYIFRWRILTKMYMIKEK
jgi:hypothetical protein